MILEHADGLARRGYPVTVVGPEPRPDWFPLASPYLERPLGQPGAVPPAEVVVASFWTTVGPAVDSGARHVFHFCQGFEGVHREYAPILDAIDAAYRLPIPKLLVSAHLESLLRERYGDAFPCFLVGQGIDRDAFTPGPFDPAPRPLRVGLVGPFGIRSKGIPAALEGLALARRQGLPLVVERVSADPLSDEERELGATDLFHHRLTTGAMAAFYQRIDALVYPSHDEEGFPLPPLEAMASGVPVAVSRIRPFAVLPDEAVVRFEPGRPEEVARAVRALADPARRPGWREAGLRTVAEYDPERVLDRVETAFAAAGALAVAPV